MQIRHQDWREELEGTNYPFGSQATLRNSAGTEIGRDTFLDARLHAVGGRERSYLSRVVVEHDRVTVWTGDAGTPQRSSGVFSLPVPPDSVRLTDEFGRPAGLLVSEADRLARLGAWGIGTHDFRTAESEFAATVQAPMPEVGVRGVLLDDGTLLTGPVRLVAEDGIVLRHARRELAWSSGGRRTVESIRVDVVGDPLFRRRLCTPADLFSAPRPIRRVRITADNGSFECSPDEFGRLFVQGNDGLVADPALRVRTTSGGLLFEVVGTSTSGA